MHGTPVRARRAPAIHLPRFPQARSRPLPHSRELSVKWYVHYILGSAFSPILKGLIVCLLNTLYEPIHAAQAIVDALASPLNGLSSSAVYSQQDRDRDYDCENGASLYHRSSHRGPTPPSIATLLQDDYDRLLHPSSAHKPNGSMDGHARTSSSRSVSRSPHPKPAATTENTGRGSSRGSKSSVSDGDAEGEDADDAEAEVVDGDADAMERNTSTDEEWLKKEDA
ncbi:uncharacterized protein BXZ73DRAFT_79202 [Epithele typhae]|uniref:uncharacterized protein n=1 Tax=Epithele typhae TaxID=378194 RepID=UPI0020074D9F|nr:uncharacterized protein BXZ73DRAFT_79202 [Epithele typhae]KAH9924643.1 hypothetical protein BXZ73DRAFT_79202 [Epithele typhae]